jgi:hypothetical protein
MKKKLTIAILVVLTCSYLSGPFIAGTLGIGQRDGPIVYPEALHESIYIIAHEGARKEKPRLALDSWMYNCPLFYGLPRRLKPAHERLAYIEMARRNESPFLERMEKMNTTVEAAPSH